MNQPKIYTTGRDIKKTKEIIILALNQLSKNHKYNLYGVNFKQPLRCSLDILKFIYISELIKIHFKPYNVLQAVSYICLDLSETKNGMRDLKKLDWVGLIDNRPYLDIYFIPLMLKNNSIIRIKYIDR